MQFSRLWCDIPALFTFVFSITISADDDNAAPKSGVLSITVTTPKGNTVSKNIVFDAAN
jgi:hypothetical protein